MAKDIVLTDKDEISSSLEVCQAEIIEPGEVLETRGSELETRQVRTPGKSLAYRLGRATGMMAAFLVTARGIVEMYKSSTTGGRGQGLKRRKNAVLGKRGGGPGNRRKRNRSRRSL